MLVQKPFVRLDWAARGTGGRYLFGDAFSGAAALLYVMLRWAAMLGMAVPADLSGFAARVEERDAVRATLAFEELEPLGKTACVIWTARFRRRVRQNVQCLIYVNSSRSRPG